MQPSQSTPVYHNPHSVLSIIATSSSQPSSSAIITQNAESSFGVAGYSVSTVPATPPLVHYPGFGYPLRTLPMGMGVGYPSVKPNTLPLVQQTPLFKSQLMTQQVLPAQGGSNMTPEQQGSASWATSLWPTTTSLWPTKRRRGGRTSFTRQQMNALEEMFEQAHLRQSKPSITERKQLAEEIRLTEKQVTGWFKNRYTKKRIEQGLAPKRREVFTDTQREELESSFTEEQYPSADTIKQFCGKFNLAERRVYIWFQNRRAKQKRLDRQAGAAMNPPASSQSQTPRPQPGLTPLNFPKLSDSVSRVFTSRSTWDDA